MITPSDYVIPAIVTIIILHGTFKGIDIFTAFVEGVKEGFKIVLNIIPSLVAIFLAIGMFSFSGGLDVLCSFLNPVSSFLGIPAELIPLTILSPVSGSGSLGMFEAVLKQHGADSFIGRCASVMMGSTETTFYTTTVYYGAVGVKKSRHTLLCALCADFTSFIFSPRLVKLFFYQ